MRRPTLEERIEACERTLDFVIGGDRRDRILLSIVQRNDTDPRWAVRGVEGAGPSLLEERER